MKKTRTNVTPAPGRRTSSRNQQKSTSPLTPASRSKTDVTENRQETSPSKYPVRYITENLIKKVTGKENVAWVTTLKLNLHHEGGKRFKYIENLEKCRHLEVLSLSCNQIAKIEHLDKLTRLRELDLSFNCITHIEGLDTLVALQKLNLAGNLIECIPAGLGKKLKRIRVLRLSRNLLFSLHDIAILRPMRDLTQLSIEQNPLCELPHYRQYIVFQLRSLESLDGVQIVQEDRTNADERFQKEELENLEIQINKDNEKIKNLELNKSRTEEEMKKKDIYETQLQQRNEEQKKEMKELHREIETKNELLRRKTAELTKACEKQYRLEQELAFYKIDHKFDPLGPYPEINDETEDGGTEEAAYLGKAIFKRNTYAGEGVINPRGKRIKMMRGQDVIMSEEKAAIQQQLQKVTDDRLAEKERQIQRAESRLQKLQDDLRKTENQVLTASEELQNIAKATPTRIPSEQKMVLENQLADKMAAVNQLRQQVIRIEQDMDRTNDIINQKERQMAQLRRQLERVGRDDPKYADIEAAMKQERGSVGRAVEDYEKLQHDMNKMLATIAKETEDLKNLEEKLALGQADMNDELKEELEDVVKGLTDYLERVKKQAEDCQRENQTLQQEKDSLVAELEHAKQLKEDLEAQRYQAKQQQKYVDDLEATLTELQQGNDMLQKSVGETSRRMPELEKKLKRTQDDNERLKAALTGRDTDAADEIHALEDEIESQKKKLMQYREANEGKEQEYNRLVDQLGALQAVNRSMKDNLRDQEERMNDLMNESINPNDVSRRIDQVKDRIENKKGKLKPINEEDKVGQSLGDLQEMMEGKLKEAKKEMEKSKQKQKEVEAELREMKQQLRNSKHATEKEKDNSNDEIRALHDVIDKLQKQLKDAQRNGRARDEIDAMPVEDDWPDWKQHENDMPLKGMRKGKRSMEENGDDRRRSDQQIAELQAELKGLKDKLKRQSQRPLRDNRGGWKPTERSQRDSEIMKLEAIAEAEAHASEQVRQAARELKKAQDEISDLEQALSTREQELLDEINRGDTASQTIGDQQQEIDVLYETLDDQKGEILRLHRLLNQAAQKSEDAEHEENDPIQALLEEVESLRRAVIDQGVQIAKVTTPTQQGILKRGIRKQGRQPYVGGGLRRSGLRFSESVNGENDQHNNYQHYDGSSFIQQPTATSTPYTVIQPTQQLPAHHTSTQQLPPHHISTQQLPPYHISTQQLPPHHTSTQQLPPHQAPPASMQLAATPVRHDSQFPQNDGLVDGRRHKKMEVPDDVLFCNVPEHHDLEDYVKSIEKQSLKEKKRSKYSKSMDDRLQEDLHDRHNELEELDLAIEKQKDKLETLKAKNREIEDERRSTNIELEELLKGMNQLKKEGEELRLEKEIMEKDLQSMRMTRRKDRRREFLIEDDESEGTSEYSSDYRGKSQNIHQEIVCTERTLAKRRAELREADKLLHECEEDLKSVREKANETLNQYDEVTDKLKQTHEEVNEMEKRAQESAKEIIHLETQLVDLKGEVDDMKDLKTERQEELKAVELVIASRDAEFRSLDTKTKHMSARFEKIKSELLISEQKVLEQTSAIRDATRELTEKNTNLNDVSTQIINQEQKLATLLQDVAQKETELQRLSSSLDTSKQKLVMALKDGEAEVSDIERKIAEAKFKLEQLNKEKMQLSRAIGDSNKKLEESEARREETDKELQLVEGNIDKSKTELKHTLELIQLEKTELEALRIQHERKMAELEQTQISALEERAQLENIQTEVQQKQLSLECTRQTIEIERAVKEQLTEEKLSMETGIGNLQRERDMLEANCENMGSKVRQFKRQQSESEAAFETLQIKLQKLSKDVAISEKELSDMNNKRSAMLKELHAAKHKLKDLHQQVKTSSQEVQENTDKNNHLENELKDGIKLKKEVQQDVDQLKTDISRERDVLTDILSQQHTRQEELHKLLIDIERHQAEADDSRKVLENLKTDLQHEKDRMINFQSQFEKKESDLMSSISQKTTNLRHANEQLNALQVDIGNFENAKATIQHLEAELEILKHDVESRNDEKTQLAETLNFSHAEIQSLRNENREIENQMLGLELKLQQKQMTHQDTNQSNQETHKHMKKQIEKLTHTVEEHRSRANRLNQELLESREQYIQLQEKNARLSAENNKDKKLETSLQKLRKEIKSEVSIGLKDLEMSRFEVLDELQEMHEQKKELTSQLDTLNHSVNMATLETHVDRDGDTMQNFNHMRHRDTIKERFEHEQAMLKLKIKQQVERQAEILDSVRRKSEQTLSGVKQKLCNFEDLVNKSNLQSRLMEDDQSSTL